MNTRDAVTAGRAALTGLVQPPVIPSHSSGQRRRRRFSSRARGGARHTASAIAAALGRGCRQLTPALLGGG